MVKNDLPFYTDISIYKCRDRINITFNMIDLAKPHTVTPVPSQALVRSFEEPPGKVYLLYGERPIFRLSLMMAAHALHAGSSIAVVDGCNRFDAHSIARFAREWGKDPADFLGRIFVSRGFTCYQMEAAITNRLSSFLRAIDSRTALIFGLLDTFYDEQAPMREVQQILQRVLRSLREMKEEAISILLTCTEWNVLPQERNRLFATLKQGMDRVYRLDVNEENKPLLFLERQESRIQHSTHRWESNSPRLVKQAPHRVVYLES